MRNHCPVNRRRLWFFFAGVASAAVLATGISAAEGHLDPTFSGDGKILTDFGGRDDRGYTVAVQPDGKVVVGGETGQGADIQFALVRYGRNGGLDTTFDGDGLVQTAFAPGGFGSISSIATLPGGKTLAAGVVGIPGAGTSFDFGLARYNADGTLDSSFGAGGKVVTDVLGGRDWLFAIAIQRDGKIVVCGHSRPRGPGQHDLSIVRYNPDGSLDSSFDTDGKLTTAVAPDSDEVASGIAVQPDGKIVVSGWTFSTPPRAIIARYSANGSLDDSFDGDGLVVTSTPTSAAYGLALQPNGKILTAGEPGFSVTRFNSDGTLDTTFGAGDGIGGLDLPGANAFTLAVQPDGMIVAAGSAQNDFAAARFRPDGSLDRRFGSNGRVLSDLGGPAVGDVAYDVALQPGGKIVLAGLSGPPGPLAQGPYDFAVARYVGSECRVPNVRGRTLVAARAALRNAKCRSGKVTRKYSRKVRRGRVISQRPNPGMQLPELAKVNLVVSRGRRR